MHVHTCQIVQRLHRHGMRLLLRVLHGRLPRRGAHDSYDRASQRRLRRKYDAGRAADLGSFRPLVSRENPDGRRGFPSVRIPHAAGLAGQFPGRLRGEPGHRRRRRRRERRHFSAIHRMLQGA